MATATETIFSKEVGVFADQIQAVEDALFDVASLRLLPVAVGTQLDVLGDLIGGGNSPRLGMSDADYRTALIAQCQINQSKGEPERLIAALVALTGCDSTTIEEYQPATVVQLFTGGTAPANLLSLMRRVKAAGVKYSLIQSVATTAFQFTGDENPEYASTTGLSDEYQAIGGQLSDIII